MNSILKIIAAISYIVMVLVNISANALPLNNRATGQISDSYPNLFAPAGLTFSIWGIIYLLLAGYVICQFLPRQKYGENKKEKLLKDINTYFIVSSMANIAWIFAWHYNFIGISLLLMSILLVSLIKIAEIIRKEHFTTQEKLFISTPFSVYFGWITVATIANVTVYLVSIGWNGFGIADYIWTSIILIIGVIIGILRLWRDKKMAYGFVFIWAYLGILIKHLSVSGFNGEYPNVIATLIACLLVLAFFQGRLSSKV